MRNALWPACCWRFFPQAALRTASTGRLGRAFVRAATQMPELWALPRMNNLHLDSAPTFRDGAKWATPANK